jgi:hypothetical protein
MTREEDVNVQHIEIARTGPEVTYTELLRIDWNGPVHEQCRIRICSFAPQRGYALIERWDVSGWHELYTIAPGAMQTEAQLYLQDPPVHISVFRVDRDFLVARAVEILR